MIPYNAVEKEGSKYFVSKLSPSFKMPSRKSIATNIIPKLYDDTVNHIKSIISNIQFFSMTTDSWTSSDMEAYLAVTLHFIDEHFQMHSVTLTCKQVQINQTAANLKTVILETLEKWDIRLETIVCCTTDCGANIVAAVKLLDIPHLSCFGHALNTGVSKAVQHELINE